MIAIHNNKSEILFHYRWIAYCEAQGIPYKLVNCFANDILKQLDGCKALMWHFHQANPRSIIMAKPLLFALEQAGMTVFPDFNTAWHFDDKIGQKYLLEALGIDLVPTWIFYDQAEALTWIDKTEFPKVFKLRGGAASQNVKLVPSKTEAKKLVKKAFGRGFEPYDAQGSIKERWRLWRLGKTDLRDIGKGLLRIIHPPDYAKTMGKEINYIYFQEFMPNNSGDTRIIVIGDKAFAIKRMNRENDFRASGSGHILYDRSDIDERCVSLSFAYNDKLKTQCVAFDYVYDRENKPRVVEISFGFANKGYDKCTGYWDKDLRWYPGSFDPYGWMVEQMRG